MSPNQAKRRTETISVRLDPRLRYQAELAARKQRRTISSFVEWAIEASLDKVILVEGGYGQETTTLADVASSLWDVLPADRFVKLAFRFPDLLDHEEQLMWKLIRAHGLFWKGYYDKYDKWIFKTESESNVSFKNLRTHWELINQIARGEVTESQMPQIGPSPAGTVDLPSPDDDSEDIPF
jgi:hypothetical protein